MCIILTVFSNFVRASNRVPVENQLGHNIRFLRKMHGLSQQKLAEALGLKRNNIASYEAGIVEPRAVVFVQIAQYFHLSPSELLHTDLSTHYRTRRPKERPAASMPPLRATDLIGQLEQLSDRTDDMEKVIVGFREFFKYRRQLGSNNDYSIDFENLIDMLERLLRTNRSLIKSIREKDV